MAATGAYWNGLCYSSQDVAKDAYFGSASVAHSPTAVTQYVKTAGVWELKVWAYESSSWVLKSSASVGTGFDFPACDPTEGFFDGIAIGWGIAAAMIAVAALKLMQRAAQ